MLNGTTLLLFLAANVCMLRCKITWKFWLRQSTNNYGNYLFIPLTIKPKAELGHFTPREQDSPGHAFFVPDVPNVESILQNRKSKLDWKEHGLSSHICLSTREPRWAQESFNRLKLPGFPLVTFTLASGNHECTLSSLQRTGNGCILAQLEDFATLYIILTCFPQEKAPFSIIFISQTQI